MNDTWNERPKDLKPEELNAWALTTISDALGELSGIAISLNDLVLALANNRRGPNGGIGAFETLGDRILEGFIELGNFIEKSTIETLKGTSDDD
jgi:hypothetical protein